MSRATWLAIDLFGVYHSTLFAHKHGMAPHGTSEAGVPAHVMWTGICTHVSHIPGCQHLSAGENGCALLIKVCRCFLVLALRQALSAQSPVGCVGPALGDINTPLMRPFP